MVVKNVSNIHTYKWLGERVDSMGINHIELKLSDEGEMDPLKERFLFCT